MWKKISLLLLCLGCGVSNADVIGPYAIGTIEASETGVYFSTPPGLATYPNPYGCQNATWVVFDLTSSLADRALAIGLAAQAQSQKVRFQITGCYNTYIKANVVQIDTAWQ
jgi:hypothetical protein